MRGCGAAILGILAIAACARVTGAAAASLSPAGLVRLSPPSVDDNAPRKAHAAGAGSVEADKSSTIDRRIDVGLSRLGPIAVAVGAAAAVAIAGRWVTALRPPATSRARGRGLRLVPLCVAADGSIGTSAAEGGARAASSVSRRAGSEISVEYATEYDLPAAARIAVRAQKWTEGTFEGNERLSDEDYKYLESYEVTSNEQAYLKQGRFSRCFLVAKAKDETGDDGGFFGGFVNSLLGVTPGKVVGCIGCAVKSYSRDGIEVDASNASLVDTVQRPVMADLAVDTVYQGRGIARKLISKLEEVVVGWGYKELALFVEATNLKAIGVYNRLGYSFESARPDVETSYLDTNPNTGQRKLEVRKTLAILMRKQLA